MDEKTVKTARLIPLLLAGLFLAASVLPCPARAEGWKPRLTTYAYSPEMILAIDKDNQKLYQFTRRSPLKLVQEFPCTTGQSDGDKLVQGDLKTPEGVYFVGGRLPDGLDRDLYGGVAYSLNFPNPIDKLKGKSGSGIWLHGRGKPLVPRDTRGCVALHTEDLLSLDKDLKRDTPVVIAQDLTWSAETGEADQIARTLASALENWAHDWESRSDAYFSHYDPQKYAQTENTTFAAFKAYKHRIFASKPWIQVMVGNIRAVQGPDYWVTVFDQYYRTVDMANTVGKRFYWQKDASGQWRIVGREYTDATEDMEPRYLEAKSAEVHKVLDGWLAAWRRADLKGYAGYYDDRAEQGKLRGRAAIADFKKGIWDSKPPKSIEISDLRIELCAKGLEARFVQDYQDASGYADHGLKTLVLAPEADGWRIVSEDWRTLK